MTNNVNHVDLCSTARVRGMDAVRLGSRRSLSIFLSVCASGVGVEGGGGAGCVVERRLNLLIAHVFFSPKNSSTACRRKSG